MDPDLARFGEELRHYFDSVAAGLRQHIDTTASDLRQELTGLRQEFGDLRQHVDTVAADTRRHFDVVSEGLRGEIRLLAEAVDFLSETDRVHHLETAA
jgi:hypothetical protein